MPRLAAWHLLSAATYGFGDAISTAFALDVMGLDAEANPGVRQMFEENDLDDPAERASALLVAKWSEFTFAYILSNVLERYDRKRAARAIPAIFILIGTTVTISNTAQAAFVRREKRRRGKSWEQLKNDPQTAFGGPG